MSLPEQFISCDWGTSNFRLRLLQTETLEVLQEHHTDKGVKVLHREYMNQKKISQNRFFSDYLTEQLEHLNLINNKDKKVIVASGMASSSIGMYELGYSQLPFSACGKNLFSRNISLNRDISLLLVSGAVSSDSVMRGEETQAVGLSSFMDTQEKGILLLPGTHSKHMEYNKGLYNDFKTFMTGELFKVICTHSILSNSVRAAEWEDKYKEAFIEGIKHGCEAGALTQTLFTIRAKDLMKQSTKEENFYFLSGLFIGDELSYLKTSGEKVTMSASGTLFQLYKIGMETVLEKERLAFFEEDVLEKALFIGQKKILEKYA